MYLKEFNPVRGKPEDPAKSRGFTRGFTGGTASRRRALGKAAPGTQRG